VLMMVLTRRRRRRIRRRREKGGGGRRRRTGFNYYVNMLREDRDSSSGLDISNLMMTIFMVLIVILTLILLLITMGRITWVQGVDMKESMVNESAKFYLFKKTLHTIFLFIQKSYENVTNMR